MNRFLLLVFLSLITLNTSFGQKPIKLIKVSASMHAYKGDLNTSYTNWTSGAYVGLKLNRKHRLNGTFAIGFGKLTGQKAALLSSATPATNRFFKTNYFSFDYSAQYNLINKEKWRLFISQGFGILRYNPKDELSNSLQDLSDTREDGELYGNIMLTLPTQFGGFYFLPNKYAVGAQIGFLNFTSDYIDNISKRGTNSNGDNALQIRFSLYVPLKDKKTSTP